MKKPVLVRTCRPLAENSLTDIARQRTSPLLLTFKKGNQKMISKETVAAVDTGATATTQQRNHYFRFHLPHMHLASVFGDNWFALKAEAFARFFGTPVFIIVQTIIVASWIAINAAGLFSFDVYPFILLNLAFSLQAAYAAPLILLAQTRQAERDKVHAEADAQHREALALASEQRQVLAGQQTAQLVELLQQNTKLTEITKDLSLRIEALTQEIHGKFVGDAAEKTVPE
jgi:uncharacterized membrane protein